MNYIRLTDNDIFFSETSLFIETPYSVEELSTMINSLQKFLTACIDGHDRKVVDMLTVVKFLTIFCDSKVVDSDYAMDCAINNDQMIELNDFESEFWEVDIVKAAVGVI